MFGRNKIAMLVAEFLGTGFLTLVVLGVQRSTLGLPYFIAIAAGVTVAYSMYVFGGASGAQMNPALTIALWTARRVKTTAAIMYIAVQLLGGWAAYALYHYFVNSNVQAIHNPFTGRVMVAEAVGTLIFTLGWSVAAYNQWKVNRFATIAGISFAVGVVVASAASLGIINPAVAIGARAWQFWGSNGWGTYALGPVVGAVIGVNLYGLLFAPVDTLIVGENKGTVLNLRAAERAKAAAGAKVAPVESKLAHVEKVVKEKTSTSRTKKPTAKKPAVRKRR
jgi:glycerol uptake facilitator-like aquaporin